MNDDNANREKLVRSARVLSYVNVGIWALAMIAMVFLMQDFHGARKLYPILGGGTAVGIALITSIAKLR